MEHNTDTHDGVQYVLFHLGSERYGLPIANVQSIIRYEPPTPVPHAPESVEGVINLRGQVIPVVDLQRRLLAEPTVPGTTTRVIVAESTAGLVGLMVDAVSGVVTVAPEEVRPAPDAVLCAETAEAFTGVVPRENGLIILLDADKALPHPQLTGTGEEA